MKKLLFILLAVSLFIFLFSVSINSAIIFLVKKQLNTVLKGSEVTIGSCRLNPLKQLSLFDIGIKNKPAYNFLIKEVRAEYSLSSIFKGNILKVSLKDAKIHVNLPQESIAAFPQHLNLGPQGAFMVKSLELSNFTLDLKTKNFNASGVLSLQVNLIEKITDYLDIKIDSLGFEGINLSDVSFKARQGSSEGNLGIKQIKYNKLNISEVKSRVKLSGKELFLENLYAKAFDGNINGNLKFKIEQDFGYGAALTITNLDIARLVNDFDLKEKFEMTGELSGELTFEGKGADIEILNGELSSLKPGGMLIIKDTKFLENMARNTNQSLDLLVESFEKYHYNIGTIKIFLENRNLVLDAVLEGETGKRNINIILHNFRLKKGAT